MAMEKEKRRHDRFVVENMDIGVSVFNTRVELTDIGLGGVCIKTSKRLKPASRHYIRLGRNGISQKLHCTVLWEDIVGSLRNASGRFVPFYKAGIEFGDNYFEATDELRNFIDFDGTPEEPRYDNERRTRGQRFRVYESESAELFYHQAYSVMQICMGGVLVKSVQALPTGKKLPMELCLERENFIIKFLGRAVSCNLIEAETEKYFSIGIEFVQMDDPDRLRLEDFIFSHEIG